MLQFWLGQDGRNIVLSAMAQVEAKSGICRLRRECRMIPDEASVAFASIAVEAWRVIEQPVTSPVLELAGVLVDRYPLRAMDAVQLASAVVVRDLMSAPDMRFIASDLALLDAAGKEGFAIWNPCSSP